MNDKNFLEHEVTIPGEYQLKGTLAAPKQEGKYPAVLIIAGSGDITRDGTITSLKVETNIYRDLAQMIANLGFVALRYDKRGVGESEGDFLKTGMWDLVEDVEAGIKFLKEQSNVDSDRVFLLGHSEGCTLATAVNARTPVSGLIMISGAAESILDATKRQRDILFGELKSQKGFKGKLMKLLKIDEKGEKQARKFIQKMLDSKKDVIKVGFKPVNAKWNREHFQYNVLEDLKKVTCPVLALTGDKDFQANPERLKDLQNYVQGESEYHIVQNMDHGLTEFIGEFSALKFKEHYIKGASKPLHPELQRIISEWLDKV